MEGALPGTSGGEGAQRSGLHHVHHPEGRTHRHWGEGTAVSNMLYLSCIVFFTTV